MDAARENPSRISRFFHLLVAIGMLEALMGFIQYFIAPGWIFGYQNAQPVSGTLINKNHFAGLLEMMVPVCIGLGFIAVRRYEDISRSYFYVLCGAIIAVALAFSLSRMGIFVFFATMLFLSVVLLLRKSQRRLALGLGLGLTSLVMAAVLWIGIDVIVQRYQQLFAPDALVEEGRALVYRDTVAMIRAIPTGVGVGMYQDRFRQYQTFHPELLFDHAHNDYLETTAEWGVPIAVPFWVMILTAEFLFLRTFVTRQSIEEQGILLACSGSVFAILVHSLADFNLQIPSNAILFFTFIGIGLGIVFRKREPRFFGPE
jgi:O-antigen ligase